MPVQRGRDRETRIPPPTIRIRSISAMSYRGRYAMRGDPFEMGGDPGDDRILH
jgi:hypothetical protein